jgi:hypothetical protein
MIFITDYAWNAVQNNGHLWPDMQVLTTPLAMDAPAAASESSSLDKSMRFADAGRTA